MPGGDVVAALARVKPLGLMPLRPSIFMVRSPLGADTSKDLSIFGDIDQSFYVKPEGEQFLCSPADETSTPCPPSDAKAGEMEIARAIDETNVATTMGVRSVGTSWAGLHTFVPDRNFVVGPDPEVPGFHWSGARSSRLTSSPRGLGPARLASHRPGMSDVADH